MASAEDPSNPAAAAGSINIFNEDEELLDDDDEDDISDHDEDDSASSAAFAVDLPPPPAPSASTALVTVALPAVADLQLNQQQQQQQEQSVVTRKPAQPDERKLFQRLWTDQDEIELLKGFLDYTQRCGAQNPHHHHHDTTAFYDQIKNKFQLDFNKNQLVEKLRRLKKKYRNVINKSGSGKGYTFRSPHEQATFEISANIWGNTAVNVNGSSSAFRVAPASVEDEDDYLNHPNFADCPSPNPDGADVNSKTPRSRKRNRAGAVKIEDKQQHPVNSNNNINQPSVAVPPIAAPVMGIGITGSLSSVIEETVKSCLSPIFKELFCNSISSNSKQAGPWCLHGVDLARSPIPFGFASAIYGDKTANDRWRKQQILELEVFSKRLELVQDQIKEQLDELRSMPN